MYPTMSVPAVETCQEREMERISVDYEGSKMEPIVDLCLFVSTSRFHDFAYLGFSYQIPMI